MIKKCSRCNKYKYLDCFSMNKGYLRSMCKSCWVVYNKRWQSWYSKINTSDFRKKRNIKRREEYANSPKIREQTYMRRAGKYDYFIKELKSKSKCFLCGYKNYIGALDYHHIDKVDKLFCISQAKNKTKKELINEIKKCVLLCRNCHMEVHGNKVDLKCLITTNRQRRILWRRKLI